MTNSSVFECVWGWLTSSSTIFISLCALHKLSFQQEFAVKTTASTVKFDAHEEATPHSTCLHTLPASPVYIMTMIFQPPIHVKHTSLDTRYYCLLIEFTSHEFILPPGGHGITEGLGRATCHGWALETSTEVAKMYSEVVVTWRSSSEISNLKEKSNENSIKHPFNPILQAQCCLNILHRYGSFCEQGDAN